MVPYFSTYVQFISFSCSANLEVCQRASRGRLQDLNEHLSPSLSSQKQSFLSAAHTAQGKCPYPHRSWHQLPFLPRLLSLFCKTHVQKNLQSQRLTWEHANPHLLPSQLKSQLTHVLHQLLPAQDLREKLRDSPCPNRNKVQTTPLPLVQKTDLLSNFSTQLFT